MDLFSHVFTSHPDSGPVPLTFLVGVGRPHGAGPGWAAGELGVDLL